jgi:hypothetical protein
MRKKMHVHTGWIKTDSARPPHKEADEGLGHDNPENPCEQIRWPPLRKSLLVT